MSGKLTSYGLKAAQMVEKSGFFNRKRWVVIIMQLIN